jgi:hypothetical protein
MSQVPNNLGISYTIDLKGNLAEALGRLSNEITSLRSALDGIATDLQGNKAKAAQTTDQIAKSADRLASATDRAASACRRAAAASKEETSASGPKLSAAEKRYKALSEEVKIQRDLAKIETQRQKLTGRLDTPDQSKTRAAKELNAELNKALTLEAKLDVIRRRGIELSERQLVSQGLASRLPTVPNTPKAQIAAGLASPLRNAEELAQIARATKAADVAQRSLNSAEVSAVELRRGQGKVAAKAKADAELEVERATIRAAAAERKATSEALIAAEVRRRQAGQDFEKRVTERLNPIAPPAAPPTPPTNFIKRFLGIDPEDDKRIGRLVFSLQRLVATVLLLKAIRNIEAGFRNIVVQSIKFNAELETAQLGIATIITGAGQIRDITGQQVQGARAFALAQREAARQTALLRIDALNTVAPLNKIIETFQTAIGPGLAAGLNLDQIRQFSVQISQAATAIGLEQNQLAEEIRSILTGTINTRQTRIATVLGITNDDIRRAKEAGTLADLLKQKFEAFNIAGAEISNTFDGAVNRLKTALLSLGSEASLGVFEELKGLFNDISRQLLNIDRDAGTITLNPQFRAAAEAFFSSIQRIVASIRQLSSSLNFNSLIATARTLGAVTEAAFQIILGVVQGIVSTTNTIINVLGGIKDALKSIPIIGDIFETASLRETVALVTQIYIAFGLVTKTLGLYPAILKLVTNATLLWAEASKAVQTNLLATGAAASLLGRTMSLLGLIVRRTVVGFVAFVAIAAAFKALQAFGLLPSFVDKLAGTEKEIQDKREQIAGLRNDLFNFYNNLPAQIEGSTESLKAQEETIASLRREFEKLNTERKLAFLSANDANGKRTPVSSLSGFAAEATKIATEAILQAQEKVRAIELDRVRNSEAIKGAAQQELQARVNILNTIEGTRVSQEQIKRIQDGILSSAQKVREANERAAAVSLKEAIGPDTRAVDVANERIDVLIRNSTREASSRSKVVDAIEEQIRFTRELEAAKRKEADQELKLSTLRGAAAQQSQALPSRDSLNVGANGGQSPLGPRGGGTVDAVRQESDAEKFLASLKNVTASKESEKTRATERTLQALRDSGVEEKDLLKVQSELLDISEDYFKSKERLAEISRLQGAEDKKVTEATRRFLVDDARRLLAEAANAQSAALTAALPGEENAALRDKVQKSILSLLEVEAKIIGLKEKEKVLDIAKLAVSREVNQQANARLEIAARTFAFEQGRQNVTDRLTLENQIAEFAVRRKDSETQAYVQAQGLTRLKERELELVKEINRNQSVAALTRQIDLIRQLRSLRTDITGSPTGDIGPQGPRTEVFNSLPQSEQSSLILKANDAQNALNASTAAYGVLIEQNRVRLEQSTNAVDEQRRIEEENRIRAGGPGVTFGQQLTQAAEDLNATLPSKFAQIFATLSTIVTGFSSFAADSIVDAFDPTKKVDLKERFARFLQDVARQIINQLVTIAVTKAALGLTGILSAGFAAGGEVKAPQGFRHGGSVGRSPTRHVRGYAGGGNVVGPALPTLRPAHVDPKDTVPAWLSVGEFVQPVHRVQQYGSDLFEAFRQGWIDPFEARMLMPSQRNRRTASRITSSAVRGYAAGGSVSSTPSTTPQPRAASGSGGSVVVPAVVANENTMDQLLRGGGTSLTRFLDEVGFVRR